MKRFIWVFFLFLLLECPSIPEATLWDRGGGLIYDDVLNVTWLQDANYAKTSGYDVDGLMLWDQAIAWAEGLSYYDSVRNTTWTDWRLPQNMPVNGISYQITTPTYDGSTDRGGNISAPGSVYPGSTASEMAYMYYNNLSNICSHDLNGDYPQSGWTGTPNSSFIDGNGNSVPFENLMDDRAYWSSTEYPWGPFSYVAFGFRFYSGIQTNELDDELLYSWVVKTGDVPIPGASWLLGSGLVALVGLRRKLKKN